MLLDSKSLSHLTLPVPAAAQTVTKHLIQCCWESLCRGKSLILPSAAGTQMWFPRALHKFPACGIVGAQYSSWMSPVLSWALTMGALAMQRWELSNFPGEEPSSSKACSKPWADSNRWKSAWNILQTHEEKLWDTEGAGCGSEWLQTRSWLLEAHGSGSSEIAKEFMFLKTLGYNTLNPDKLIPTY